MLCVLILYKSDGTYSFKSNPNDRFIWETLQGNYIYSQSFCPGFAFNKLKRYVLDYGETAANVT